MSDPAASPSDPQCPRSGLAAGSSWAFAGRSRAAHDELAEIANRASHERDLLRDALVGIRPLAVEMTRFLKYDDFQRIAREIVGKIDAVVRD